jgi:negative regulator of sigma-B (phosphoserine phosphatase)
VSKPAILSLEWGSAARALPGERTTGDVGTVLSFEGGVLVAVVDGLGHGAEAAHAARSAVDELAKDPADSVIGLTRRAHQALHGSRGAAMSLASIDTRRGMLTWIGVGNVQGVIAHQDSPAGRQAASALLTRGGVVGSALPQLRAEVMPFAVGDVLFFATDGVDAAFSDDLRAARKPAQQWADDMLAAHAKTTDDALVLVARAAAAEHA